MGLADVLGENVHQRLVGVFDDPVVLGIDVEVDVSKIGGTAPEKPVMAMTGMSSSFAHRTARTMFSESPPELIETRASPGLAKDRS